MSATIPEGIDLQDPDSYVERLPLEWFDRLRDETPVAWHPEPSPNRGFWAVTRYDDLIQVHMDWRTFSSEVGAVSLEELDPEQLEIRRSMLETDPPRHTELRKICSKRLSARSVGQYEDWIRDVAREVLDRAFAIDGPFDFVAEISRELPIRFLCSIFTVPQDDAPQLIRWGDEMIGNLDPELAAGGGRGDPAVGDARSALPPHGDVRHRASRPADQGRRQGRDLVREREPRRGSLRGRPSLRRHPQAQRTRHVRAGRTPLLSRFAPG